ncbi:hypothetical protein FTX61_16845 [Nitriliruptoraceae bacterium ZYF776]|nr:hypothetical protein [Profundirhabdus halotolerans]
MSELDEIVGEFLVESYENLDRYDEDLLALEQDPRDGAALSSIFRTMHTIKGTAGFFGFSALESFGHVAENLLGKLRDGELSVTQDVADALLASGDTLRSMLAVIEETGEEGDLDVSQLIATLTRLLEARADGEAPSAGTPVADDVPDAVAAPAADVAPAVDVARATPGVPVPTGAAGTAEPPKLGEILVGQGAIEPEHVDLAVHQQELGDDRRLGEILVTHGQAAAEDVEEALETQAKAGGGRSVADTSIRVDVGLLDELMNLVGELVLARNQILQLVTEDGESEFSSASQRLNLITTELQEGVMKTRMQPIGNVWGKLPRIVRDLSNSLGKQVELRMEGQDTELDKTIIEAIKDPLTHLVRNAVDHGIESTAERLAAGKSAGGVLTLRAFHEGGQVNIEIADDGAGIDADKLRAKAVANGVITAEQARLLGDREAHNLIFAPGFSTAAKVTNVSGRGVGMDVVRTNIERIGGTVDVHTELGGGTTFKVKIPLTLAIVPALIVSGGGDRYAIPQLSLIELVRLEGEQARSGIELVHGAPVHRLRGRLLPIVELASELGQVDGLQERSVINIVVLHTDGQQFGLVVDDIHDTQEIVVKPLGSHLKDATLFAGATIMGDGQVSLILDVLGIAQRSRVVGEHRERGKVGEAVEHGEGADQRSLLLVDLGEERRAALPLSDVERLEEFPLDAVELAGGREVVQYRDDILPLLRLGDVLGTGYAPPGETLNVVVHTAEGRSVGLVVGRILDIVDHVWDDAAPQDGSSRSAIIQDRVTDLVDLNAIVARHHPAPHGAGAYLGA